MYEYMHSEKEHIHPIQILRQDNAKENVALIKIAKGKDWMLAFEVKFTARKHTATEFKGRNAIYSHRGSGKKYAYCSPSSRFAMIQIVA